MFSSFFPGKLILAVAFVVTELKLLLKTPETLRVDDDENDFGYDEIFAILNTACCALIRRTTEKGSKGTRAGCCCVCVCVCICIYINRKNRAEKEVSVFCFFVRFSAVDKLEKQVSQLPKKDLSKGQRSRLFWLKEVLEMNTSLALFLSFSLFVSPKNLFSL